MALAAISGLGLVATNARAQAPCPALGVFTVASCGGDTCSCALPCSSHTQCGDRCCVNGYCALNCACPPEDGGVVEPVEVVQGCTPPEELPTGSCTSSGGSAAGAALVVFGISRRRQKDLKLLQ